VPAGAKVLAGGSADGPCYRPTILADVPDGARIRSKETFGPVLVAQPVQDTDEAVAIANEPPAASRRSQGQRLGPLRPAIHGRLHRTPVDHHQGRHGHLSDLARSGQNATASLTYVK
jgi:hypothetical protein